MKTKRKEHLSSTCLENHSVELDILAEGISGNLINVELQMYKEPAPFKRTRYYLSSIDMSILEKGTPYYKLPDVTAIYITKDDFIGGKKGHYGRSLTADRQNQTGRLYRRQNRGYLGIIRRPR